ncbi:MAG: ABC transporter ATP-binding protein [Desulfurococcaceae archaeon]|nr:MAG: ABC transporter ATP-binding protein [Desulfurococcaceae archaeon]
MSGEPLLLLERISKRFGNVVALREVDLAVRRGEVVGLVGDNGAGKSTLAKIIVGYYKPDSGRIIFDGKERNFGSPLEAREAGIEIVYQDMALVSYMNIYRNIFLGREIKKGFGVFKILDKKAMKEISKTILRRIGIADKDPDTEISKLSGGERQAIAIARAVHFGAKLIIFDEPTSALSVRESNNILNMIRDLGDKGISSIVISHNIHHIYSVADRIVVLERGTKVLDEPKDKVTPEEIEKIVGYGIRERVEESR